MKKWFRCFIFGHRFNDNRFLADMYIQRCVNCKRYNVINMSEGVNNGSG